MARVYTRTLCKSLVIIVSALMSISVMKYVLDATQSKQIPGTTGSSRSHMSHGDKPASHTVTVEPTKIEQKQDWRLNPDFERCRNHSLREFHDSFEATKLLHLRKHKLVYCQVPKVASTSMKAILCKLTENCTIANGSEALMHDAINKQLRITTLEEIKDAFSKSYSIAFVRNPWKRLASAYQHKFVETKEGVYFCRFNYTDVPFIDFLKCVIRQHDRNPESMNEHWKPSYRLCHLCSLPYSFIGKMERFNEVIPSVLKHIGVTDNPQRILKEQYRYYRKNEWRNTTGWLSGELWKTVPSPLIHDIGKIYEFDLKLFGYDMNPL